MSSNNTAQNDTKDTDLKILADRLVSCATDYGYEIRRSDSLISELETLQKDKEDLQEKLSKYKAGIKEERKKREEADLTAINLHKNIVSFLRSEQKPFASTTIKTFLTLMLKDGVFPADNKKAVFTYIRAYRHLTGKTLRESRDIIQNIIKNIGDITVMEVDDEDVEIIKKVKEIKFKDNEIITKKTNSGMGTYDENKYLHSFDDKPSYVHINGTKYWHKHGKLHREGKPAVIFKNGNESWLVNGKLHRTDGPAKIFNGVKEFWENGKFIHSILIDEKEKKDIDEKNQKTMDDNKSNSCNDEPTITDSGFSFWKKNKVLHRDTGPAITNINGTYREYWKNGKCHRVDGPAVIDTVNNMKQYWINGERLTEDQFNNKEPIIKVEGCKTKIIKVEGCKTKIIKVEGCKTKTLNKEGKLHSFNDNPALICKYDDGGTLKQWYDNGVIFRESGPATRYSKENKSTSINK